MAPCSENRKPEARNQKWLNSISDTWL